MNIIILLLVIVILLLLFTNLTPYNRLNNNEFFTVYDYASMDDAIEEGNEWYSEDLAIDFASIDYLTAVDVLTRIMNEEIGLCNGDNEPYYNFKKEAVV